MRRLSWSTLQSSLQGYSSTEQVMQFAREVRQQLHPLAVVLFGSLAKGDWHEHSDADVCVILDVDEVAPFEGHGPVTACDPSGVVEPVVYGRRQFQQMLAQANPLALEVLHDGIILSGDGTYLRTLATLYQETVERLGLQKVGRGWRMRVPR